MLDCSCNVITHDFYRAAARAHADDIKSAKSFGSSIGLLFTATHPGDKPRDPCQDCTPHIGRAIVEEGLRPQEEFDEWRDRRSKILSKCTDTCSKARACANGFGMGPL